MKNKPEEQKTLEPEKTETRSVLIGVMSLEQLPSFATKPAFSEQTNQPRSTETHKEPPSDAQFQEHVGQEPPCPDASTD